MRFVVHGVEFYLRFHHYPVRHGWVTECGITRDGEPVAWTSARCNWRDLHLQSAATIPPEIHEMIATVATIDDAKARTAAAHVAALHMARQEQPQACFTRTNRRIGREIAIGRALKAMYPDDRRERRALLAAYHAALRDPANAENAYRGVQHLKA